MSPDARPVYCVNDARQIELGAAHLCVCYFFRLDTAWIKKQSVSWPPRRGKPRKAVGTTDLLSASPVPYVFARRRRRRHPHSHRSHLPPHHRLPSARDHHIREARDEELSYFVTPQEAPRLLSMHRRLVHRDDARILGRTIRRLGWLLEVV